MLPRLTSDVFNFQLHENDDLRTIDSAALARLTDDFGDFVPLPPSTPLSPSIPETVTAQSTTHVTMPSTPVTVPSLTPAMVDIPQDPSVQEQQSSEAAIDDEVVRSCVTPRKFLAVKDVLQKEPERHKCALKLLPYFFSSTELGNSNTDGTHNKLPLDSKRLNSLKVLVFSRFPLESAVEKEKTWKFIKGKINAKCRLNKHIQKQAGENRES